MTIDYVNFMIFVVVISGLFVLLQNRINKIREESERLKTRLDYLEREINTNAKISKHLQVELSKK